MAKTLSVRRTIPRQSNLWRHIVGIASVLFTFKDPFDVPVIPGVIGSYVDGNGNMVYRVRGNSRDVSRLTAGRSVEGKRIVHTRVGRNLWEIRVEDN